MLTAITIENFKGIGDRCGWSCGRSPCCSARTRPARAACCTRCCTPARCSSGTTSTPTAPSPPASTSTSGDSALVHGHDLKKTIRLTFNLDLNGIDLPGSADPDLDQQFDLEFHALGVGRERSS